MEKSDSKPKTSRRYVETLPFLTSKLTLQSTTRGFIAPWQGSEFSFATLTSVSLNIKHVKPVKHVQNECVSLTAETHAEGLSESDVASVRQRRDDESIRAAEEFVLVDEVHVRDAHQTLQEWVA